MLKESFKEYDLFNAAPGSIKNNRVYIQIIYKKIKYKDKVIFVISLERKGDSIIKIAI